MKQLLILGALMGIVSLSSGCTALQKGCMSKPCDTGCSDGSCSSDSCGMSCNECGGRQGVCSSGCNSNQCGGGARGCFAGCKGGCSTGCRPGPLHWQQGGSDYAHKLSYGMLKHGQVQQNQGPPSASVAYPYYTVRGPRDFLLNNPPTIGH